MVNSAARLIPAPWAEEGSQHMYRNRIAADPEAVRLPRPPEAPLLPQNFCWFCVRRLLGNAGAARCSALHELYHVAFEAAKVIARPSLPERDLLAFWN